MKLTDFDALSFDCYGTLIDWETGLREGLNQVSELAGPNHLVSVNDLLETYADAESAAERDFPATLYPDIIRRSIIVTGEAHGIAVPEAIAQAVGASVPAWPAFSDSSESLRRLGRHFRLIILSNVDRASFAASNARLGITFDAILTAQDIGSYKPDPRNFNALMEHARETGIGEGKLLHVAQSLFHDHVPAKAKGLPTVWIDRRSAQEGHGATPIPSTSVQPDWTFPSMATFANAVDTNVS